MKIHIPIISLVLCLVTVSSCSLKRKVAVTPNDKSPITNVLEKQQSIHDLDSKVNVNIDQLGLRLGGQIKMTEDSCLWASVQAFLGIEAGRALITTDRIQIINRLEKNYIDFPLAELGQDIAYQALPALTSILMNRVFVPLEKSFSPNAFRTENKDGRFYAETYANNIRSVFTLDQNQRLTESSFSLPSYNWSAKVTYSDFRTVEIENSQLEFPFHLDFILKLSDTQYYHASIDLVKPVFNSRPDYPFEISASYKKANISDLMMFRP